MGSKDSRGGHHDQLNVGNGHTGTFGFFLGILEHDDILRNTVGLGVVLMHVRAQGNHVHPVEPPAVKIEESDDVQSVTWV